MRKKIKASDVLFTGLAFFATFFGAGNLIFPPMLGLQSGTGWPGGLAGMLGSGVGLPILALLTLGHCGSVHRITDRIGRHFFTLIIGMLMLLCCCVSIPRTAAVGIEMGLHGIWGGAPYLPAVAVYFVLAFLFAKDRGSALDKVGKILTPVMTVILLILVVHGVLKPLGSPAQPRVERPFLNSFLGGYSSGDVLVSFLMAGVFFGMIRQKGYEGAEFRKVNFGAGMVAAFCLAAIYGGLFYMGACVSGAYQNTEVGNAGLLLDLVYRSGGTAAIDGLCLSVVLACLTTAIGQITAAADFFETATNAKIPYRVWVIAIPIFSALVASLGLDNIVRLTAPWFTFLYPITLVLTALGLLERWIPNDGACRGAIWFTIAYAVLDVPSEYGLKIAFLDRILARIPLYDMGFGWVIPAVAGFFTGLMIWKLKNKKERKNYEPADYETSGI